MYTFEVKSFFIQKKKLIVNASTKINERFVANMGLYFGFLIAFNMFVFENIFFTQKENKQN